MDEIPTRDTEPAAAPASSTAADLGSRFLRYLPLITIAHFVIGLPALIASLALAWFAFVQADATQKMQTGGVMPFVTFGTSNGDEDGNQDISLSLTNNRSEEHTSELQSLMRITYAVFCLKKKNTIQKDTTIY